MFGALIILSLCMVMVESSKVDTSTTSVIQRINYGVIFQEQSGLMLAQEYWLHTFHIPLPTRYQKMGSAASSKGEQTIVVNPIQAIQGSWQRLMEKRIEKKKTMTFKSLEKAIYILSDINGHLDENGVFDDDLVKASFDLSRHDGVLKNESFEINRLFETELGDIFVQLGGVKTVCDLAVFCLKRGYYDEKNKLIEGIVNPFIKCLIKLQNFTDANPMHCHLLVDHGEFLPQILEALRGLTSSHLEDSMQEKADEILADYISIIYNIAQSENCNTDLRNIGFVDVLLPYLNSSSDHICLVTLSALANLVNVSEAKHLETNGNLFKLLLQCLTNSMKDRLRRCGGWSARELAKTIRKIANNDVNKKSLVAEGSLPVLVTLSQSKHEDEQIEAFYALWTLSFDEENQEIMLQDDAVMETFINSRSSKNKKIHLACDGALWNMRVKLRSKEKYKEKGYKSTTYEQKLTRSHSETKEGHVMISYQWANQNVIKRIRDNLRENGIKCWMDVDDMRGSTLDAMAQAVEDAEIFLMCYSKKYKDSSSCRAEAEYAYKLKKPIIPLKMERDYEAQEWLGFIIGSKIFYEFTDKYTFETKITDLIKEVLSLQKKSISENLVISHVAPASTEGTRTFSSKPSGKIQASEDVKKWKEADVLRWINYHNLPSSKFSCLTGIEIAYLQVLRQESPDFFHKALSEMLKITDILTMAKFSFALDETLV